MNINFHNFLDTHTRESNVVADSAKPENHWPISIVPITSKILENTVYHNLITFLENKNPLSDCQCGFRSKRSTKLVTTLFCDTIRKEISNGKPVGSVYIDFSKALDTISHSNVNRETANLWSWGWRTGMVYWLFV